MQPEKESLTDLCALFRGENLVYFNKIIRNICWDTMRVQSRHSRVNFLSLRDSFVMCAPDAGHLINDPKVGHLNIPLLVQGRETSNTCGFVQGGCLSFKLIGTKLL